MSIIRSRTSAVNGRIVIAGTGRAGTTFLVQLFTALGFDTGYSFQDAVSKVDYISHAGLEQTRIDDAGNPYVIKSPWFADQLLEALQNQRIKIHAAIIPMRDLFEAAESRRRVYYKAMSMRLNPMRQPGTLWLTNMPTEQENILAIQLYKTIYPLAKYEINTILIEFPRLVQDSNYLFRNLHWLLEEHGVSAAEFADAYRQVARPELISDIAAVTYAAPPLPLQYGVAWVQSLARKLSLRLAGLVRR